MENKNDKFRRLATKRTNDIISKIRILGNLSNKSSYTYSDEEVQKIFKVIEDQLKDTKNSFLSKKKREFSL
ncbi:hypothetical protein MCETALH18_01602 [Methylophilaceae bacterium]|jgi:hypothetical protein